VQENVWPAIYGAAERLSEQERLAVLAAHVEALADRGAAAAHRLPAALDDAIAALEATASKRDARAPVSDGLLAARQALKAATYGLALPGAAAVQALLASTPAPWGRALEGLLAPRLPDDNAASALASIEGAAQHQGAAAAIAVEVAHARAYVIAEVAARADATDAAMGDAAGPRVPAELVSAFVKAVKVRNDLSSNARIISIPMVCAKVCSVFSLTC
jgi:hypothetical protein